MNLRLASYRWFHVEIVQMFIYIMYYIILFHNIHILFSCPISSEDLEAMASQ